MTCFAQLMNNTWILSCPKHSNSYPEILKRELKHNDTWVIFLPLQKLHDLHPVFAVLHVHTVSLSVQLFLLTMFACFFFMLDFNC